MSYKYNSTKHEGIYDYTTKTGKKLYRARFTAQIKGVSEEISKQGFKKISAAKAFKREMEKLADADKYSLYKERKRTLKEHWSEFREIKVRNKKWNDHTLETNEIRMNFWLSEFGNRTLNSLETDELQRYIDKTYDEKDLAQPTIHGSYRILNQVLKDALNENYISKNPINRVSYVNKNNDWKPENKLIELDDFYEYIETAEKILPTDTFCGVMLLTYGLRRGEVYGLRPNSFTFLDDGLTRVDITRSRTAKSPKGKQVKSDQSNRIIIVNEATTELIKKTISISKKIKSNHNRILHEDDYLLLSDYTGDPCKIKELNEAMDEVSEVTGIKAKPHMLRHTFATHASALGVDSIQLQNFLGHADVGMTKHYSHGSIESAENVMRITENLRNK